MDKSRTSWPSCCTLCIWCNREHSAIQIRLRGRASHRPRNGRRCERRAHRVQHRQPRNQSNCQTDCKRHRARGIAGFRQRKI
uniref:Uncharacterized protein n=1 Tax=Ciona savignyi TaxID=51511 RepID=H2Y838_CIOSA